MPFEGLPLKAPPPSKRVLIYAPKSPGRNHTEGRNEPTADWRGAGEGWRKLSAEEKQRLRNTTKQKKLAAVRGLSRGHAGSVLEVAGGVIRFYDKGADHPKYFVAVCSNHHNCVRTRQATASKQSTKTPNCAAKGRPLGQLVAWLAMGQRAAVDSKAKHWKTSAVEEYCTHAMRLDQRLSLEVMDGGPEMLAHERPTRDGEGDEPAGLA